MQSPTPPGEGWGSVTEGLQKTYQGGQNFGKSPTSVYPGARATNNIAENNVKLSLQCR